MARRKRNIEPQKGWAIYLRTSDKDAQNPENSQRRQRHVIERSLVENSGLPIIEEYVDNLSGRSVSNRYAYQKMLEDARAGKFSHVGVENAERFGRNDAEALPIIDELHKLGVSIRFADYPDLDPVDPDDRILVSLSFTLARRESIKIGQRTKGGMYAKRINGGYCGIAPDGYINREEKTNPEAKLKSGRYTRWIEIDEEQARVWRMAWDLLLTDRYTLAEICEKLHAKGYRFKSGIPLVKVTKTGKRVPAANRLSYILHNWTYAGWVVSERTGIPPKKIRGRWEPIVTTEEFEHGLAILDRRNRKPDNHYKHHYLLKALVYLHDPHKHKLIKLTCSTSNSSRANGGTSYYCVASSNINIPCRNLDKKVSEFIKQIQVDPELIPQLREYYARELKEKLDDIKPDERTTIKQALELINQEEERTLRLFAAGKVTEEIWNTLWHEWQDRRQKLQENIELLEQQIDVHIKNLDVALHIISKIGVLYDGLDKKQKRNLLRDVIERVVVDTQGNILKLELKSPFAYLQGLKEQIGSEQESRNSALNGKTPDHLARRSNCSTSCAPDRIRTYDSRFRKPKLFPLSYWSNVSIIAKKLLASTTTLN